MHGRLVLGMLVLASLSGCSQPSAPPPQRETPPPDTRAADEATIQGLVNTVQMPVGVASPVVAGLVFDATGTYVPVFMAYACTSAIAALAIISIRRPTLAEAATRRSLAVST